MTFAIPRPVETGAPEIDTVSILETLDRMVRVFAATAAHDTLSPAEDA